MSLIQMRSQRHCTKRSGGSKWGWTGKKNLAMSVAEKRRYIEPDHPEIRIQRQCELVGLNRASWYYQAAPAQESPENLGLMPRPRFMAAVVLRHG